MMTYDNLYITSDSIRVFFQRAHELSGMTKHVLIPLDDSDPSWEAFEYAIDNHVDERLTGLHVINPLAGDYYLDEAQTKPARRSEELGNRARTLLEEHDVLETTAFEMVVEEGKPEHVIVDYAEANEVDQIVMGSRGRSGLSRVLLGSVAEVVVRRAPVPVTIVR